MLVVLGPGLWVAQSIRGAGGRVLGVCPLAYKQLGFCRGSRGNYSTSGSESLGSPSGGILLVGPTTPTDPDNGDVQNFVVDEIDDAVGADSEPVVSGVLAFEFLDAVGPGSLFQVIDGVGDAGLVVLGESCQLFDGAGGDIDLVRHLLEPQLLFGFVPGDKLLALLFHFFENSLGGLDVFLVFLGLQLLQ
jgi:hypothetical protein